MLVYQRVSELYVMTMTDPCLVTAVALPGKKLVLLANQTHVIVIVVVE